MNAMTCQEVEEQLDLLAADACDPPSRDALENHLRSCPTCAAKYAESRRLLGLLDLQWNEQAVERLRRRIDQEARPARRFFTPFMRGTIAVAALLLVAVGMIWWLSGGTDDPKVSEPQFALVVRARKPFQAPALDKLPAPGKDKSAEAVAVIPLVARGGPDLRADLAKAQRDGKLPAPPAVSLELALVNAGKDTALVRLGDALPTLELDLPGEGVVRVAAPKAEEPEFLRPQTIELAPNQKHVIQVDRLIAGSPGKLEYIYVTEPGDYTLTARVRMTVNGKVVIVTGTPVRIKVGG